MDDFSIGESGATPRLLFDDLEIEAGFEEPALTAYRYGFFHNACDGTHELVGDRTFDYPAKGSRPGVPLGPQLIDLAVEIVAATGSDDDCERYFFIAFQARRNPSASKWGKQVKVHLYFTGPERGFEIVGVEHEG